MNNQFSFTQYEVAMTTYFQKLSGECFLLLYSNLMLIIVAQLLSNTNSGTHFCFSVFPMNTSASICGEFIGEALHNYTQKYFSSQKEKKRR